MMRFLVATGGAPHSTVALTFAAHLAQLLRAGLVILTVVKQEEERVRAEAVLESAEFILTPLSTSHRIPIATKVRVGHPAEEILAEAEAHDYALLVVGEKQHHGLVTRFLLGSTAQRVVEHAPCPVVVVKGQVGEVKRLLICDGGAEAAIVDRVAAQLPGLLDEAETITVLHVMSQMSAGPGVDGHQLRADARELIREHSEEGERLAHDVQVLQREGYRGQPKVRHGRVVDEVLAEAQQGNYDLVVIGAHQGLGWRRILLDDLAHQLVVGLDRPVLVVR